MPGITKPIVCIAAFSLSTSLNLLDLLAFDRVSAQAAIASPASVESRPTAEIPIEASLTPLTPACPLPPILLPEQTAQEVMGLFIMQQPTAAEEVQPLSEMTTDDHPVSLTAQLNPQIRQLVEAGKLEEALILTRQIQNPTVQADHLALISSAYLDRGQIAQAEVVAFSIPASDAAQIGSGLPAARDRALLSLVTYYINNGQLDSALIMLIRVTGPYQVYKLLDIAEQYRQQGSFGAASAVLDFAEEVALSPAVASNPEERDEGPPLRVWALWKMAKYYISKGQLESALAVVERLDEMYRGSLLLDIAQGYRQQGRFDLALPILDRALATYRDTMQTFLPPSSQPDSAALIEFILNNAVHFFTLDQFASDYMALNQPEKAAELASETFSLAQTFINQGTSTLSALLRTVKIYRAATQNEQANAVLAFVAQKADALEQNYLKAIVLSDISQQYVALGDRDRAQQTLSQAEQIADTTIDVSQRNLSAIALIQAYMALDQFENASRTAEKIEPPEFRQQVQQAIVCAQTAPQTNPEMQKRAQNPE